MPTVLIQGPYRFFWYSADGMEPPHVHVERDMKTAKFWLEPIRLAKNNGFAKNGLVRIEKIIRVNQTMFLERWRRDFGR